MNTQTYPGQALSLSQLVFALGEELKRSARSPSLTYDETKKLDKEVSAALATIREWRNSFVEINCISEDVLSLIPAYLPSQGDRLRASSACRYWRRIFLQRAELWTQLFLSKGEEYVKTLLDRAQGSPLDIVVAVGVPVGTITPLASYTEQFKFLELRGDWTEINTFTKISSGPLPLLHTLVIHPKEEFPLDPLYETIPSSRIFSNAVNLRVFRFISKNDWAPFLPCFFFPNLTSFNLSVTDFGGSRASQLLDFLEASPALRMVDVKINAAIPLDSVLQGRIVTIPNAENFSLTVADSRRGYQLAAHISCPSARQTSLTYKVAGLHGILGEIFPDSASWSAIVDQYTMNPVEEVTFEIKTDDVIKSRLTFQSPDAAVIELSFQVIVSGGYRPLLSVEEYNQVFSQAAKTIHTHPQLTSVKRFNICHGTPSFIETIHVPHIANEVGRLFKSLAPLDNLTIYESSVAPYFHRFLDIPQDGIDEPVVFPEIKDFTISQPFGFNEEYTMAVVGFAKSQYELGIPLERVIVRMDWMPHGMEERLKPWVGSVEHDPPHKDRGDRWFRCGGSHSHFIDLRVVW